ncbi:MAG: VCBS repeat-containing protein [Chloroflexi bacterium]|nr:VCBS repeat-containing protein [Chloroflexota bacterium]
MADIDSDNDLDAITPRKILWNMGGNQGGSLGQFMDSGQPFGGANMLSGVIGDLDGDGDKDALLGPGDCSICSAQIWFNNGNGTFSNSGQAIGYQPIGAMALGDLDGDGDLDAYINHPFGGTWTDYEDNGVWFNDGNGVLTDSYQALGQGYSPAIALGDLNGDGTLDAFVGKVHGVGLDQ